MSSKPKVLLKRWASGHRLVLYFLSSDFTPEDARGVSGTKLLLYFNDQVNFKVTREGWDVFPCSFLVMF